MSEWAETELNKIGEIVSGGTPSTAIREYWDGDILFVTPHDLSELNTAYLFDTQRKISKIGLSNSSANLLPIGSIIISSRAPIGYIAIAGKEFTTNQGCKSLVPYPDHDSVFLYYCLNYFVERIKRLGAGSTFTEISKTDLESIKLPHPLVKNEQRKIARILSTIDSVIEKTQSAIDKYKAIKQGMLNDLFTRGIDIKTGKLRPKYEDAPDLYKPSKLGWIPVEWNIDIIEKCGEIVTGSTPSTARSDYYGDEFLFVSPSDIQEGIFISNTEKRLTRKGFDICRQLPERTICVVCIGSTIGKIALLVKEGCTNQQINSVICFNRELSFYYFYAMLYYNEKQFRKETGLQAVPIVNKHNFSKFVLPIIKKNEAIEISSRLKTIDNKLHIEQIYLYKLQMLKSGLMSDLLSGKKPVKVNDEDLLKTA